MTDTQDRPPTVLITGAGGGLGGAAVERFLAGGWRVAAADLHAPPATSDAVLPLTMDVTDQGSVDRAMVEVEAWSPHGLDAIITYAGVMGIGPLMDLPIARVQQTLDVNVMGTHRAVHAAFGLLRRAGGRVVLIGSETGWQQAMPMNGAYAMSKHAIEAYADALRRELMFAGLSVVLMQPGPFRSNMTTGIVAAFDAVADDSPFKPIARAAAVGVADEDAAASDPRVLADAVFRATTVPRPRDRYSVRPNRQRAALTRLPVRVVDHILRRSLERVPARPE